MASPSLASAACMANLFEGWGQPSPPSPPPEVPGEGLQWTMFVILFLLCCINTLFAPISAWLSIGGWIRGRAVDRLRARLPAVPNDPSKYPPVCAIVPCFLPNEEGIIMGTIQHIITHTKYPGELTLMVVYNTPKDMAIEEDLHALEGVQFELGRRVKVLRVHGSRSKAENLNEAIKRVGEPLVAIYDADHHPDPESLTILVDKLEETGADAVQGSVYIRDLQQATCAHSCLARFIGAEFFAQFFIFFPILEVISSTGFFGGSNALWRVSVLRDYQFSTAVQTEDIDVSARAILNNRKLAFCPEARSGELTPADLQTLYRQRLRWLIGWDQVTLSCMKALAKKRDFSLRKAFGLFFIFPLRWLIMCMTFCAGVITPYLSLFYVITDWGFWTRGELYYSLLTYWLVVLFAVLRAVQHDSKLGALWVVIFYASGPLYITWTISLVIIGLVKIFTGKVGAWHVTRRANSSNQLAKHADLDDIDGAAGGAQAAADGEVGVDALLRSSSPAREGLSRIPSWIAFNPFGTFRFNQVDEPLDETRRPRETIPEEDGGSLSPNGSPTWLPTRSKSEKLKALILPSSYSGDSPLAGGARTSLH